MNHQERGIALLINNNKFPDAEYERKGSEKDLNDLHPLFKDLNLNVIREKDKTSAEIKSLLSKYANPVFHQKSDCFLCVVMSHGNQEGVLGVDNKIIDLKKEILDSFNDRLVGKPKLFFINACRGENQMRGSLMGGGENGNNVPFMGRGATENSPIIPTHSDILTSYSTVEEFVSFRNQFSGSLYIQSLVKMIKKHYKSKNLIDILTYVNNDVAKHRSSKNMQMPS